MRYYERAGRRSGVRAHAVPWTAPRRELIERRIYVIRGEKVMLDRDLAGLYEVTTSQLNLSVKRNLSRFPEDFMFQLSEEENLRLQDEISSSHGGRRYLPYAFTEHGVAMLSSVLRSERAVQMNIRIVRAFMKLRALFAGQTALSRRIEKLAEPKRRRKPRIGFVR